DTVTGLAQGSVNAVGDLIATVLHRKRPRRAPHGSPPPRRQAAQGRAGSADATEAAIEAVDRAKKAVERTADAGQQAVRSTASSDKTGTRRTPRRASQGASGTARA